VLKPCTASYVLISEQGVVHTLRRVVSMNY